VYRQLSGLASAPAKSDRHHLAHERAFP
jgi:hypothetical protein